MEDGFDYKKRQISEVKIKRLEKLVKNGLNHKEESKISLGL